MTITTTEGTFEGTVVEVLPHAILLNLANEDKTYELISRSLITDPEKYKEQNVK